MYKQLQHGFVLDSDLNSLDNDRLSTYHIRANHEIPKV